MTIDPQSLIGELEASPLKILFLSAEVAPLAKVGGLGDVASALPKALKHFGQDVRVMLPRYGCIPKDFPLSPIVQSLTVPLRLPHSQVAVHEGLLHGTIPLYVIDSPHYFDRDHIYSYPDDGERFLIFCRAALEAVKRLGWCPDIIHCNDWHTAIVPNWLGTVYKDEIFFRRTATIYTIHSLAAQGTFGYDLLQTAEVAEPNFRWLYPSAAKLPDVLNLAARGMFFAERVTTVSPTYAQEILTDELGFGLAPVLRARARSGMLSGILNGIDTEEYNPTTDRTLPETLRFDVDHLDRRVALKATLQQKVGFRSSPSTPVLGMVTRLAEQKGIDLLNNIMADLMDLGVQLAVLGNGAEEYQKMVNGWHERYPRQVHVDHTFNEPLARLIYAGSDLFLMPSRFEPCGLAQMIAMHYGSIPIVHSTGGLADTVEDCDTAARTGNGFRFRDYTAAAFLGAINRALQVLGSSAHDWHWLMVRAMLADFSWEKSAAQYLALYRRIAV
ncbi:MAG: glycogen synthase [Ktedonobacterales bacterium]